ncbi:MAG: thioredoxin family protein [bacterium]
MKEIKVLGPGCPKCEELLQLVNQAAKDLALECHIEKITDIQAIIEYGILMTPALVVDKQVVMVGKVPALADIKKMIG